jgi:predicted DNA-binding ribbon-helix-helix protein
MKEDNFSVSMSPIHYKWVGAIFMKSPVVKRSVVIAGRQTSVSLEDAFWNRLRGIASQRQMTLSELVATIDSHRRHGNLSSALRLFVLDFYCSQASRINEVQNSHTQL